MMDLILLAVVALGALFFLIGYLAFVAAGFKHHFITGVIATLPVINIITVPVLWYLTGKKLILSVIGIVLIIGAWFLGADKGIDQLSQIINGQSIFQSSSSAPKNTQDNLINSNQTSFVIPSATISPSKSNPPTSSINSKPKPNTSKIVGTPYKKMQRNVDNENLTSLPLKPLYTITFETVPTEKYNNVVGLFVRISTKKNDQIEGNVSKLANNIIYLRTRSSNIELPVAMIENLQLMVKQTN